MPDFTVTPYVRGPGRLIPLSELLADASLRARYPDIEDAHGGIEILDDSTMLFVDDLLGIVAREFLEGGAAALRKGEGTAFRHRLSDEQSTITVTDGMATVYDADRLEKLTCPPEDLAKAFDAALAVYQSLIALPPPAAGAG